MIGLPTGTRIWIAAGVTDLRRGFTGLSGTVQTALKENPFSGHVFVFRGRRDPYVSSIIFSTGAQLKKARKLSLPGPIQFRDSLDYSFE